MNRRAFIAGGLLFACTKSKVTDAGFSTPRIVSLSPSTTETIAALGALTMLVARSRYCDYPPEVLSVPDVGGYVDPNLEAILAVRPTLVVGARGPAGRSMADTLEKRGVATFFPETESLAAIDSMITGLGEKIGRSTNAVAVVQKIHDEIAAVSTQTAGKPKVRALLLFGVSPIIAAGPKSFADELLTKASAVNVVTEGTTYPTLDLEAILRLDPEVILNCAMAEERGAAKMPTGGAWEKLRAVRSGRVVTVDDERVLRPGPRIGEGLTVLAHALR